jgi:ubiquinone/menaquinone biosynthesis C-methylase UbiE
MASFYAKLFAKFYDKYMVGFEEKIIKDREKMLKNLTGTVLDVGSGTGVNFIHFNKEVKVYAVEPSKPMMDKSVDKINSKNIELLNLDINDEKLHNIIKENSLDAIVSTLVLCTIKNPELALDNFKKWLKPDGKLIIIEHIHSDKKGKALVQTILNPVWKVIAEGCNMTRHTDKLIKSKGFKPLEEHYFTIGLRIHKGIFVVE